MIPIKLTDAALARAMVQEEKDRQQEVLTARVLHDGSIGATLTDRLKQYVVPPELVLNICKPVVKAVIDRLKVNDWEAVPMIDAAGKSNAEPDNEATKEEHAAAGDWAWSMWTRLGLDVSSSNAHLWAVRDGEAFALVSPKIDNETGATLGIQVVIHPRWTATDSATLVKTTVPDKLKDNAGQDYGMKMFYPNDDPNQDPDYASLWWVQTDTSKDVVEVTKRRTLFFADRVEKYAFSKAGTWERFKDPGDAAWPIPWTGPDGLPLGIPVAHFINEESDPEARDVWGIQGAVNKSLIDLLTAADATAFRIFVARGWVPTTDGLPLREDKTNALRIQPGSTIVTKQAADVAALDVIEGASVAPLADVIDKLIVFASITSGVPLTAFQMTRQLAGAETLAEQKDPLVAHVERIQASFGRAWEKTLETARKLANVYMSAGLDELTALRPVWAPAKSVDPGAKMDEARGLQALGVPAEIVWAKAGLTQEEIKTALASPEYQARIAAQQQALGRPSA